MQNIETDTPLTELGLPEIIDIEPTQNCNLSCLHCHVSTEKLTGEELDPKFIKNMKGMESRRVLLGEKYEPFSHSKISEIITGLSNQGLKIEATTNGTFFTPELETEIVNANWVKINVSFDGGTPKTFESIRKNADYGQTLENIINFKNAIQSCRGNEVLFSSIYTMLRGNIHEIPHAVGLWEGIGFDSLIFNALRVDKTNPAHESENAEQAIEQAYEQLDIASRHVINNNCRITLNSDAFRKRLLKAKEEYPVNFIGDAVLSNHPEAKILLDPRDYFQKGHFPGMKINCRSPFKYVRILYNGDVELCYKHAIGNIYEDTLFDIWFGEKAQSYRASVKEDPSICQSCDYFNNCIREDNDGHINSGDNPKSEKISQHTPPLFAEDLGAFHIIKYGNCFHGLPKNPTVAKTGDSENSLEEKGHFKAETVSEVKSLIEKFLNESELSLIQNTAPSFFVEDHKNYNIRAWLDGYFGIPKSFEPFKLKKLDEMETIGAVAFNHSLENLKKQIDNISNINELSISMSKPVEYKNHNIFIWRGEYVGAPHSLGAIDPETDNLKKMKGVFFGTSATDVERKIDWEIDEKKRRERDAQNLQITAYKGCNTFRLGSKSYAVPQSLGAFDPLSDELESLKGVLTAKDQDELEKKIDWEIDEKKRRERDAQNLQIIAYKGRNTFRLGSKSYAVPQSLGAFDPLSDELESLKGVLTAKDQDELEKKIDQEIIEKDKLRRSAENLNITVYKEHKTFQLGSEFLAIPNSIGAFDPLSDELKSLKGVIAADNQKELEIKINQKILAEAELQRKVKNLRLIAYKGHNTFNLGSEYFAVPQSLGAFDPLSDELKSLNGVIIAESYNQLKLKIDEKIADEEKLRREASNLEINTYKGHNTFHLGAEFIAVPQSLGAFDPLSNELKSLNGVLTADGQKQLEVKIDQKIADEEKLRREASNLEINTYKGHNTFHLNEKFFAVPQSIGAFDPLSSEFEKMDGVLTADGINQLEDKIDQKIEAEKERQAFAKNLKIIAYKNYNTFVLGSDYYAVPQSIGAFAPLSRDLLQIEGILTADNQKKLEKKINSKILEDEEKRQYAQNLNITPYKSYNTFQLGFESYAVPQSIGEFDPLSDNLTDLEGIVKANNPKELEKLIDQITLDEEAS